ncbi:hypothetical protein ABIC83_002598 [Roseateles asaccharophilus]|uniref:hypothetical protein n=1 Tax=Roseateles asaccharophilus TaxID=582607 RepID=UPI0038341E22
MKFWIRVSALVLTFAAGFAAAAPVVIQKGSIAGYVYIPGSSVTAATGQPASSSSGQTCVIDLNAKPDYTFTFPANLPQTPITLNYAIWGGGGGAGGYGWNSQTSGATPGTPGASGESLAGTFTFSPGDTLRLIVGGGGGGGASDYPLDGSQYNYASGGSGGAGYYGGGGGAGSQVQYTNGPIWGRGAGGGGGGSSAIILNGVPVKIAKGGAGGNGGNNTTGTTAQGGGGGTDVAGGAGAPAPTTYSSGGYAFNGYAGNAGIAAQGGLGGPTNYTCLPGKGDGSIGSSGLCPSVSNFVRLGGGGGSYGGGGGSIDAVFPYTQAGYEGNSRGANFAALSPACINTTAASSSNCYGSTVISTFGFYGFSVAITLGKAPSWAGKGGSVVGPAITNGILNATGNIAMGGNAGAIVMVYNAPICAL